MKKVAGLTILMFLVAVGSALAGDPDLVFYFSYDGAIEGDTILDESGKGHDGVINGDADPVDGGKYGKAMEFSTGSFIDMDGPNIPAEEIPTEAITLCAWIKCENTGGDHAIFNAQASDGTWLIHPEAKSGGDFRWLLRTFGGTNIFDMRAGAVSWDEWMHYAGVYDGKDGILYINGDEAGRVPGSGEIAGDWGLGARVGYNIDNARPFTGLMDDICLWKRALTEDEVKAVMEQGPGGIFSDAVSPVGNATTTWGELKVF